MRIFRGNRLGTACGAIIVFLLLTAIAAPLISPPKTRELYYAPAKLPPSWKHPFGTDHMGRDVFRLVVYGSRVSLFVGVTATAISLAIGVSLGLVSGYFGGIVDAGIRALIDLTLAFPSLLLAIAISVVLGPGITTVFLALSVVGWASFARLVRGMVLSQKVKEYVIAAESVGSPARRIIFRHLLPNCMPLVIVAASLKIGGFILAESALSFLGLGASPTKLPTWGSMVNLGSDYLRSQPWMSVFPGLAIAITVIAFNIFGDALRDRIDPKFRA
ncbi:ABC transporter permease [bacterium]|nr:ABC transporter permease [bacterium]